MAEETLSQEQIEWLLTTIAHRAQSVIELDRSLDTSDDDVETLHMADRDKRQHIAFMGWVADVGLQRMGSIMHVHHGDPLKWLMYPAAVTALTKQD